MVEQQIEVVILLPDGHPFLTSDKSKIGAEFQEKTFQFSQEGGLEVPLAIRILQSEKIEQIRIPGDQLGRKPIVLLEVLQILTNGRLRQAGNGGAFEEHTADAIA